MGTEEEVYSYGKKSCGSNYYSNLATSHQKQLKKGMLCNNKERVADHLFANASSLIDFDRR